MVERGKADEADEAVKTIQLSDYDIGATLGTGSFFIKDHLVEFELQRTKRRVIM